MYNVSNELRQEMFNEQDTISLEHKLEMFDIDNDTSFVIENEIVSITESLGVDGIPLGKFPIGVLEFELRGDITQDIDVNSNLEVGISHIYTFLDESTEVVDGKRYIIQEIEYSRESRNTSIKAYDYAVKLSQEYNSSDFNLPLTLKEFTMLLYQSVGLEIYNLEDMFNKNYQLDRIPGYDTGVPILEVARDIGEVSLSLQVINYANKVEFIDVDDMLPKESDDEAHSFKSFKAHSDEFKTLGINTLVLGLTSDIDGENTAVSDNSMVNVDGNVELRFDGNQILWNEELKQNAIDNMFEKVKGFKYKAFESENKYFFLGLGDTFRQIGQGENEQDYDVLVLSNETKFEGSVLSTLSAESKSVKETENKWKERSESKRTEILVDKVNQEISLNVYKKTEVDAKIDNIEIGGRNYLLNSGDKVDFEEQDIIPTTVGEYLPTEGGRNLLYGLEKGRAISPQTGLEFDSDTAASSGYFRYTINEPLTISGITPNLNQYVFLYDENYEPVVRSAATLQEYRVIYPNQFANALQSGKTYDMARYARFTIYGGGQAVGDIDEIDNLNIKIEQDNNPNPTWTPAPEDFNNLKGKSYALSQPLRKENILSLNGSFEEDDFIGLWLGNDKFVGFLDSQELAFNLTENYDDEFVVVKTLSEKGIIDNAKLEKGNTSTDWTPAPEDLDERLFIVNTELSARIQANENSIVSTTEHIETVYDTITEEVETISGTVSEVSQTVDNVTDRFETYIIENGEEIERLEGKFETRIDGFEQEYQRKYYRDSNALPDNFFPAGGPGWSRYGDDNENATFVIEDLDPSLVYTLKGEVEASADSYYVSSISIGSVFYHQFDTEGGIVDIAPTDISPDSNGVIIVDITNVGAVSVDGISFTSPVTLEDDMSEYRSNFRYDAPTNTLYMGNSENDIEMFLKNDSLTFRSKDTGAESQFSHEGMYNSKWTNDEHLIRSFNEDGIRGTLWIDKGKDI